MSIEYTIDFTAVLPQKLTPRLNEVQTWLNCSVQDIGRGNIIIQIRPGIFILRIHNDQKGKDLENRVVNYYLPGDTEGEKTVTMTIRKREHRKKWVNPRYVTIWGVHKADLGDVLSNKTLTKFLEKYGTILEPVEDVIDLSENAWSLDKKKVRIDLDKELDIPRNCPIEVTTADGSLRVTYRDQPYYCRRCTADHVGDCPKWIEAERGNRKLRSKKKRRQRLSSSAIPT